MDEVSFEGKRYVAVKHEIGNLPLIVVKAKNAAFVSGVKTIEDLKKAKIRHATSWAEDLGIREGMSVKKALEIMDVLAEEQ